MSEKKGIFEIFGKIVEDMIINPSRQILEPIKQIDQIPIKQTLLPVTQAAIFWDYENFPIPRNIRPEIFLEALVPSGISHRIVAKRVYGQQTNIPSEIVTFLETNGFVHQLGIETEKKGITNHVMEIDCATICKDYPPPLIVVLISGDRDCLQLIQNLSSQGHDVRVVCQNKKKLYPKLPQIIPHIRDRRDIIQSCQNLLGLLQSLSHTINYMISAHPKQQLTVNEFRKEIEDNYVRERLDTLVGHLMFLLNLPDFNWQYIVSKGIITNLIPDSPGNLEERKRFVIMKLGSESDRSKWTEYWTEFQTLVPTLQKQQQIIINLYKTNNIPAIRVHLQQKLIFLCQQLEKTSEIKKPPNQKMFKCSECDKKFKNEETREQHFKAVHLCSFCPKVFSTRVAKQQHEKDKHNK
ncbi:MAG: NYN domain-containing protein [Candidatus Hodarchaeota archaeon]